MKSAYKSISFGKQNIYAQKIQLENILFLVFRNVLCLYIKNEFETIFTLKSIILPCVLHLYYRDKEKA